MDDLRSNLEIFLKDYINNKKSLENQKEELLLYMKNKDVSPEIRNMFWALLDRYSKYQNEYVKHDDNVKEQEKSNLREYEKEALSYAFQSLRRHFRSLRNKKILEIAPGKGYQILQFATLGADVTAIDISENSL